MKARKERMVRREARLLGVVVASLMIVLMVVTIVQLTNSASSQAAAETTEISLAEESVTTSPSETNEGATGKEQSLDSSAALAGTSETGEPQLAYFGPWGTGLGDFGFMETDEGNLGPLTFAVRDNGEIYVLDLVNMRVQVIVDGTVTRAFDVSGKGLCGMAVTQDGYVILNNFNEDRTALVFGPGGDFLEKLALPANVLVSRLLVRGTQLWVRGLVESEAADGVLSPYIEVWDNGEPAVEMQVADSMPAAIGGAAARVQYDQTGYLTFHTEEAGTVRSTGALPESLDHLTCEWRQLDSGQLVVVAGTREGGSLFWDVWTVPSNGVATGPTRFQSETYSSMSKPLAISAAGDIFFMSSSKEGVSIWQYVCPS